MEWVRPAGRTDVRALTTARFDGDLAVDDPDGGLAARRSTITGLPWSWLRQVHGSAVVTVGDDPVEGIEADALVTAMAGRVLAIQTADCGPVALVSREGPVGAVHAGWRGVEAGVLPAAVAALRSLGATDVEAWLGPCIGPRAYEFGAVDLDRLVDRFGANLRAVTDAGTPALDLRAAIRASLAEVDVVLVDSAVPCTATETRYFSHRARGEAERHALVVWIEP